jgi:hypothetical protein
VLAGREEVRRENSGVSASAVLTAEPRKHESLESLAERAKLHVLTHKEIVVVTRELCLTAEPSVIPW